VASPKPVSTPELPQAARAAIDTLRSAPTTPVKMLITGGIGTGKTTVLAAVRDVLRAAGSAVLTRPPRPGDPAGVALVIDDAQLLTEDELRALTERVADPASTVVVAAEPRQHDPALRALATAVEREHPRFGLGALASADVERLASDAADRETTTNLLVATAGLPFLLHAALAPGVDTSAEAIARAARFALIERLRRVDDSVLEALLIISLTPDLGAADVAAALGSTAEEAQILVDRARAGGLVEPSYSTHFLRSVHAAAALIVGNARHHDIETALLRTQIAMSTLSPQLALRLAEHGLRDEHLAEILQHQATQGRGDATQAVRLYRAAVEAGAAGLRARLADALARSGDCTAAAAVADALLSSEDPADRAAAVRIGASIASHDGNAGQAAELFSWLGPYPDAVVSAAGAIALAATGDLPAARAALRPDSSGPPTSAARAASSLADGMLLTIDAPYAVAAAKLGQAVAAEQSAADVTPDTPAALVTLAALHGGDPVRARSVIARAVRAGSDPLFEHRHRLLLGWVKMQDGQLASATADLAALGGAELHRRDALWAATLRTAIARRGGDSGGLQKHWYAAMEVLAEYSVDLYSLLPLGELWMAAARMRQQDRLQHALDQAFAVLESLGNPVLWSVPLHWAGVHAGILANSPGAVAPHGQALTAAAAHSPFAKALAGAGRTWLRVLANQVDADEVAAAARSLAQFGLTSDATRLAGQAALQTPDPRVSGAMLQVARDLKLTVVDDAPADAPTDTASATPRTATTRPASSPLSDREREVAELLLLGMPYRDIGAQLFISAKTVEHHVARIRRRLGAESRSEMLSMLRAMLGSPD
jgi:DNA-binding CsgD family transcriptional regulator